MIRRFFAWLFRRRRQTRKGKLLAVGMAPVNTQNRTLK